jgi:quercetin dioxygenase-like cupin family protein
MPVIFAADAPRFTLADAPQTVFTGLASPSRGARETCIWRVTLAPRTPAASAHSLDHEELILGLAGQALAHIDGDEYAIGAGDTIILPAGSAFRLANPHAELFEAIAVLPAGSRASIGDGEWFMPPWTV